MSCMQPRTAALPRSMPASPLRAGLTSANDSQCSIRSARVCSLAALLVASNLAQVLALERQHHAA